MLKVFSLFVMIFVCSSQVTFANDFCKDLESAMELTIGPELPLQMDAGSSDHEFTIQFKVLKPTLFKGLRMAIWHNFGNDIEGSSSITFNSGVGSSELSRLDAGDVFITRSAINIPKNMIGKYKFWTGVYARSSDGKVCSTYMFPESTPREFTIINNPDLADIKPPEVTSVKLSKGTASPGEKIHLKFYVDDKSVICTYPHAIIGECGGVWHVAFELQGSDEAINDYQPVVLHPAGYYLTEFTIPEDAPLGRYSLKMLDVGDIFDNLAAAVSPDLEIELIVGS